MRKFSVALLLSLALWVVGCGSKPEEEKPKEPAKPAVPALKDLVKEDIVKGKPSEFFPKQKPIEEGDKILVRYRGTLVDGTEFDENMSEGKEIFSFTVGRREVIQGWEKGFLGMYRGGKRKLKVPAAMGYGPQGSPPNIPPNADLLFDIEVLDVIKAGDESAYAVIDRKVGTGAAAKAGSNVTIEYEVRLAWEDTIYDSSKMQNLKPSFVIGSEKAMVGVEDGIIGMRVGGERDIWLPPVLSPSAPGLEGFPREPVTIYKIKLLAVK